MIVTYPTENKKCHIELTKNLIGEYYWADIDNGDNLCLEPTDTIDGALDQLTYFFGIGNISIGDNLNADIITRRLD